MIMSESEFHVRVVGTITRELAGGRFWLEVGEQVGEHRSGTTHHVDARGCRARLARALLEANVRPVIGAEVKLLVPPAAPSNGLHAVCVIIHVIDARIPRAAEPLVHAMVAEVLLEDRAEPERSRYWVDVHAQLVIDDHGIEHRVEAKTMTARLSRRLAADHCRLQVGDRVGIIVPRDGTIFRNEATIVRVHADRTETHYPRRAAR
jgi:hypothetical protein